MKLQIVKNTEELVLIKVTFESKLDKFSHEGFYEEDSYIRVMKGYDRWITVYSSSRSCKIDSFYFSELGNLNLRREQEVLGKKLLKFISSQNVGMEKGMIGKESKEKEEEEEDSFWYKDEIIINGTKLDKKQTVVLVEAINGNSQFGCQCDWFMDGYFEISIEEQSQLVNEIDDLFVR